MLCLRYRKAHTCTAFFDDSVELTTDIYVYNSSLDQFYRAQQIPSMGASSARSFVAEGNLYLVVGNGQDDSTFRLYAAVYMWDTALQQFVETERLSTYGCSGVEHWEMNGEHFLFIANNGEAQDISFRTTSDVYRFDIPSKRFQYLQGIPTFGAQGSHGFEVQGEYFLAIANYGDQTIQADTDSVL